MLVTIEECVHQSNQDSVSKRQKQWGEWLIASRDSNNLLYERFLQDISKDLRLYLSKRLFDKQVVEDILQDVLLAVHKSRHTYHINQPFAPWLYAIARYKLTDYFRFKQPQTVSLFQTNEDGSQSDIEVEAPETSDTWESLLDEALLELDSRQQQAIQLLKIEGLSIEEASKKMNVTSANLKVIAHRAYHQLKKALTGVNLWFL